LATDLEVGVRYELKGISVDQPGEAILPIARLIPILRESPDPEIVIDADERRVKVFTTSSEFEMPGDDPKEFPPIPTLEGQYHELSSGVLRQLIRRTIFAVGKDNTRFAITAVLWEVEDGKARLVATDTRRLAVATGLANVEAGEIKGHSHLVPIKAMQLLEKNLHDDLELVKVALRQNEVLFKTEKAMIYSRLVEGRYPPYQNILPKKSLVKIHLPVDAFYSSVRQAAIMIDDETKCVSFIFGHNKLILQAQGATVGKSKVEMPIQFDHEEIRIDFDPHFVIDMLRILDPSDEVVLELTDGQKPALFKHGTDYQYLVMPLTLGDQN
jgi:DNA polymerase-3 subunit beta